MIGAPPISTLFPSTTLFRSVVRQVGVVRREADRAAEQVSRIRQGRVARAAIGRERHRTAGTKLLRDRAALRDRRARDRKSTRLNSSHLVISYAVFCLKKKNI